MLKVWRRPNTYNLLANVRMLRDVVRERGPEVYIVRLHTGLGLDEGHSRILEVEPITLGKRVVNAFHAKCLGQPHFSGIFNSRGQGLMTRTSNEDSGWKLSTE